MNEKAKSTEECITFIYYIEHHANRNLSKDSWIGMNAVIWT